MRRIFLHAGEPKTGTSAIQLLLRDNREALRDLGYLVPSAGASRSGNYEGLVSAILGAPVPPRFAGCLEAFRAEIDLHPATTAIVSAECLDYAFRIDEKRDRILSFFRDLGLATTVVMFIRADAETLSSAYAEQVKSFLSGCTLGEFVVGHRRYIHLLKLAELPGIETIFRPYNKEVRDAGAAREFLRVIGVPDQALGSLRPERRVNQSLGPIAVAAALEIRKRIERTGRQPTDQQRQALKAELLRLIAHEEPEPSFYGVDADLFQLIENRAAKKREQFAQIAWGKSWHEVFASDRAEPKQCNAFDPATAPPEARKRYERITGALWSAAQRVMDDPSLSQPAPWERSHRRADRSRLAAKLSQWLVYAGIGLAGAWSAVGDALVDLTDASIDL
jgi:hypothetical protein